MNIHFLQHVPFETPAGIGDWARQHGHSSSSTAFYENDPLPDRSDYDWLVVLGGPMNIYDHDRHPWLEEEKRFLRDAIESGKVVLGVCLGAQLISSVLGGKVIRNEFREIGWHPVWRTPESESSTVFHMLPREFTAFHWHGDVFSVPPGCTLAIESEACANQAFDYENRVFALQFHLESNTESIENLISNCEDELMCGPFVQTMSELRRGYNHLPQLRRTMNSFLDAIAALHH
jgi:GMP synthase-like glutamine amidotransferase